MSVPADRIKQPASIVNSCSKFKINDFSDELLQHIFSFELSGLFERKTLSSVCHRWNDLTFDDRYLNNVRVKIPVHDNIPKVKKIARRYRSVCVIGETLDLNKKKAKQIKTLLKKLGPTVEEFVWNYESQLPVKMLFKFLACFPCLKKASVSYIIIDENINISKVKQKLKLPVLDKLTELNLVDVRGLDIARLAPKLLTFRGDSYDIRISEAIPKLPLEHLEFSSRWNYDIFDSWSNVTNITSVGLLRYQITQESLERLCKCCPLLVEFRVNVGKIKLLVCLASLKRLKLLALRDYRNSFNANRDFTVPSVEMVELDNLLCNTDYSMCPIFPNIHSLKLHTCHAHLRICRDFPQLRTLEVTGGLQVRSLDSRLTDMLQGLSLLQDLVLYNVHVINSPLLPKSVRQLTLINSPITVTEQMAAKLFPHVKIINVRNQSVKTWRHKVW